MKKNQKQAFTLVELIVVITILAILGTIAFLSFQGYSRSSRDSVRISDIKNIKNALELFQVKSGKYSEPQNNGKITFSGAEIRSQGIFGDQNLKNVGKLNKLPKDPLYEIEYTYSLLNNKKEYEVGAVLETPNTLGFLTNNANAAGTTVYNYINGTYNGKIAQVSTGSILYILAIPSIINTQIGNYTIEYIISNNLMSHNKNSIIPGSYNGIINNNGGTGTLINLSELVAYSGTIQEIKDLDNPNARIILLKGLQEAYSGTIITDDYSINQILSIGDIDINNPTDEQKNLACIVANVLPGVNLPFTPIVNNGNTGGDSGGQEEDFGDFDVLNCNDMTQINVDTLNTTFGYNLTKEDWCSLTRLDAYSINQATAIPYEIGYLTNLTTLDLYSNYITSIAPEIGNLSNLEALRIYSNNNITNLPSTIAYLSKISELYLDSNPNLATPSFLGNLPELRYLRITNSNLTKIPTGLNNLNYLNTLDLSGNPSLGNLNYSFYNNTPIRIENNMTQDGKAVSIEGNSTKIIVNYGACPIGYTGDNCDIATSCATQPNYLHATYTIGTPRNANVARQNTNSSDACYYECSDNYSGNDCSIPHPCYSMTQTNVDNLNNALGFSYNLEQWCTTYYLSANTKGITTVPSEIGNLVQLIQLSLYNNNITSIPTEIGNLTNLNSLVLSNNSLTSLPNEIGNLTNLKNLQINYNNLNTIPSQIGNLSSLDTLSLNSNSLINLPNEIGNLTNLINLSLGWNSLINLPNDIGNLTNLEVLTLNNNSLTNLPSQIGSLTKLTSLNLNHNSLSNLPNEIGNLTSLINLYIDYNSLSNLPNEIGNLTNLRNLSINNNILNTIPTQIGNLNSLEFLSAYYNGLTSISAEIGNLNNLKNLYLSYNSLANLPNEISNLINLTNLQLTNNSSLLNLSTNFPSYGGQIISQTNITPDGKTITINSTGAKLVITVSE